MNKIEHLIDELLILAEWWISDDDIDTEGFAHEHMASVNPFSFISSEADSFACLFEREHLKDQQS